MRLIGLVILSASLALAPLTAEAQQAGKVYRIGFLWDTPAVWPHALEAFRQGLRDLGWIAGDTTRELRDPSEVAPGLRLVPRYAAICTLAIRKSAGIWWLRATHNPKVAGSNPAPATMNDERLADAGA